MMTHVFQNRLDSERLLVPPCRHEHPLHVHKRLRQGRCREPSVVCPEPEAVQAGPSEGVRREGRVVAFPLSAKLRQNFNSLVGSRCGWIDVRVRGGQGCSQNEEDARASPN